MFGGIAVLAGLAIALGGACPPDSPAGARCATVQVLENRKARAGRRIPLAVLVLPATAAPKAADAVFFISGGPGQAATHAAASVAEEHAAIRRTRDIVLVDQRGRGRSCARSTRRGSASRCPSRPRDRPCHVRSAEVSGQ